MKRKMSLIDKLSVTIYWFRNRGEALVECCHYCNSIHIQKIASWDVNNVYLATYKCLECGATADIQETWRQN